MENPLLERNEDKKIPICRVCLNCDLENGVSVFEKYNNELICDKINKIVNIDIQEGDGLPDKICFSCIQSLDTAYEFIQKCEHSNNFLRSGILEGKTLNKRRNKDLVKDEPINTEYDDDMYLGELENADIKIKHEYNKLIDGFTREEGEFQPSKHVKPQKNNTFKSSAIDSKIECHDCGQFFKSKCKMRVHWKKEHMPSQLICQNCKKVCKTYKAFHAHIKAKYRFCLLAPKIKIVGIGKHRIFHCTQCEHKTNNKTSMLVHWNIHSGERPYSCKICNQSFSQHVRLQDHNEAVHKIKVKEGICKHCGKLIIGRTKYYKHVRAHTASFPCKLCGRVLKSKTALEGHTQRHTGIKSFTCEICAKMFISSPELTNHKAIVHMKSRIYRCDQCEYSASSHKSVTRHKKEHTGSNIPCIICGKFFDNELQLKMHQVMHDRKFKCEHCNKGFHLRRNLLTHMRNIHNIRIGNAIKKIPKK